MKELLSNLKVQLEQTLVQHAPEDRFQLQGALQCTL